MNAVPNPNAAMPAPSNDQASFQKLVERHRGELLAHCYRFTASLHDAEDLVQETFLRAWRAMEKFEGRSSLRTWLYQIATNACLNAIERKTRTRRVFPDEVAKSTTRMPEGEPDTDFPWIEPLPDSMLANIADTSAGPGARYEVRETVRLAFVAATQWLPARQRAALLLCDVLGWSAKETAEALKMSTASVNSALQRARATLGRGLSPTEIASGAAEDKAQQSTAGEYADAWERADLDSLVALLAKDASFVMPPWREWYSGRTAIRSFLDYAFGWAWKAKKRGAFRMVSTRSNGQVAFGTYLRPRGKSNFHAHSLQILTFRGEQIGRVTIFFGARFFSKFGLAPSLAGARAR